MSTNAEEHPVVAGSPNPATRYWPIGQLILTRIREFIRRPEAIFWVYGFPLLMTLALGIAFRNKPIQQVTVDVQAGPGSEAVVAALEADETFKVQANDANKCHVRLRTGKTELIVVPKVESGEPAYEYLFDPTRPESLLARNKVDDALQRAAGRKDAARVADVELTEPGGRYIDFLVPGLLGMSLMGGGLWGVGFVIVDMRIRKLLKRFLATPMRKRDFLLGVMISRMLFVIPEVLLVLLFARIAFGVVIYGSLWAVLFLIVLGSLTFSGIGLLVASRASTIETVSGLMNLVMLPLWILSGIFFTPERFPDAMQPVIKVLPLTPLISALRAVMLEGATLTSQLPEIGILTAWGVVTFAIALKVFRWK
jgi:ABC-type multidrug transport system permease subunit